MQVKGGRLEFLVPHLLRGQLLRPGFVRLSLRLGFAGQMPPWARLQFTNAGVDPGDLERVLRRIHGLESWADEWESLGKSHEKAAGEALARGDREEAGRRYLSASAAYNFAQYVVFLDIERKRALHQACVRAYSAGSPLWEIPAETFEVVYRRRSIRGVLRVPPGVRGPAPVVVMFNGTNAVKEELHWWSDALLARGLATIAFDGPGLGETFHRMTMIAEPRPIGPAILNAIEARPELDPDAVGFLGMSLGGYLAIRMASREPRVRAVAAVSPPYSADIYWNVTLACMRRELAALYGIAEAEMGASIERITLADVLADVRCPLMIAGGGRDLITPGSEAWRIFEGARSARELIFYPRGAHDCFNVLADLRPRMVNWLGHQLERNRSGVRTQPFHRATAPEPAWTAAEAVDPDFADALCGDVARVEWHRPESAGIPARWSWRWNPFDRDRVDVVHRLAPAVTGL